MHLVFTCPQMVIDSCCPAFFFFSYTAPAEIYTLSLHDALPILLSIYQAGPYGPRAAEFGQGFNFQFGSDRKSTRLNSSHANISYAVFCLKKNRRDDQSQRQKHPHTQVPMI